MGCAQGALRTILYVKIMQQGAPDENLHKCVSARRALHATALATDNLTNCTLRDRNFSNCGNRILFS